MTRAQIKQAKSNSRPKINERVAFLIEHLDLPSATGIPDATWETFQFQLLNADNLLDITRKARQVGWSWIAAADAVANSLLHKNSPHTFVSISQDEAKEKIRYAKQITESLDRSVRPRHFARENQTEIEFTNGSRMTSNPCKPPRGKGRLTIYLDEFAHYPIAKEIYTAALPVTTRGGRLRIGSTPLGAQGMFWEIYAQKTRPYPGFTRRYVPWWAARGLCVNVKAALGDAKYFPTEERVKKYGTIRLKEIFNNMVLEDFQQEYECAWVDESTSWITWEEIQRNQIMSQQGKLIERTLSFTKTDDLSELESAIDELHTLQVEGKIEANLAGGMDLGRKKHASEIILVGSDREDQFPYRLSVSLDRCEFTVQEHAIRLILNGLSVQGFRIDETGLGMQLSENMAKEFPETVSPATFTNKSKGLWAVEMKLRFQKSQVPIPLNKALTYQIHSVRKKVTASSSTIFGSDESDHHADKFWALALALDAALNTEGLESEWGDFPV
ncbi:MAG: terminase family protein [Deltaproteobacteria bacterium]|nr:terminase family protein [Deltaproteobacteria bacterium]